MKYVVINGHEFVDKEEFKSKVDEELARVQIRSYIYNADAFVRECREIIREA